MNVYGITDRGLIRKQNQDYYATVTQEGALLAILCDGMGGARSGDVASRMAVTLFNEDFVSSNSKTISGKLNHALAAANGAILEKSLNDPDCAGMGTTIVATYIESDRHAYVLNVGDSRAYRIQPSGISQITRDHSLVADLVEQGKIPPEAARTHPNRNIITRALGTEEHTRGDLFEFDFQPGEFILMCSDGLSDVVTEQEMLYEILYGGDTESCCQRLLDIALSRGAPDNVTAVLIAAGDGTI